MEQRKLLVIIDGSILLSNPLEQINLESDNLVSEHTNDAED